MGDNSPYGKGGAINYASNDAARLRRRVPTYL